MSHECKKEQTGNCCGSCDKFKQKDKTIPDGDGIIQTPRIGGIHRYVSDIEYQYQNTMKD